jgi:hypothetical protein
MFAKDGELAPSYRLRRCLENEGINILRNRRSESGVPFLSRHVCSAVLLQPEAEVRTA